MIKLFHPIATLQKQVVSSYVTYCDVSTVVIMKIVIASALRNDCRREVEADQLSST